MTRVRMAAGLVALFAATALVSASDVAPANASSPPAPAGSVRSTPPTTSTTGQIEGAVQATPANLGRHVVVYLDGAGRGGKGTATIDQRGMKFRPYLTVIPVGGKVVFKNSDPFPHNVFSPNGEHFDLGMMDPQGSRSYVFNRAGAYTLLCNIHPGMIGYIKVVPSKYYTKVGSDGSFHIDNVPNGSYRVRAWGPKLAESSQPVHVKGNTVEVQLHLHRGS